MKLRMKPVIVFVTALASAAVLLTALWQPDLRAGEQLMTAQEAERKILQQYPGTIEKTTLEDGQYKLSLQSRTGRYQVIVNANNGEVESIKQLETVKDPGRKTLQSREQVKSGLQSSQEGRVDMLELLQKDGIPFYEALITKKNGSTEAVKVDPYSGKTISSRPVEKPPLSDKQDKPVRLITEKQAIKAALARISGTADGVEMRNDKNGVPYYLVEVERSDGSEATVEVNAITGVVRSFMLEPADADSPETDDEEDEDSDS